MCSQPEKSPTRRAFEVPFRIGTGTKACAVGSRGGFKKKEKHASAAALEVGKFIWDGTPREMANSALDPSPSNAESRRKLAQYLQGIGHNYVDHSYVGHN